MRYLWLTHQQAAQIAQHAAADAPHEACGILGGLDGRVLQVVSARNIAADPWRHYHIDDAGLVAALRQFEQAGIDLIGFYHSHPMGEPIPSQTDIAQAAYPDCACLIVGLKSGEAQLGAWQLRYGQVDALPLHVGTLPPPADDSVVPLSRAQITAIFISALLVFAGMLALSVWLLPPAPEIPIR